MKDERFRALFDNSGDAIFIHGKEGRIQDANYEACRRYGYSREEFLHLQISDIDEEKQLKQMHERLSKVLTDGKVVFESVHRTKSGHCFPVDVSVRLIDFLDESFIIATCRDITERKLLEKERIRLETEEIRKRSSEAVNRISDAHVQVEKSLIMSEKRLALATQIANIGYWELDLATKQLYWSDRVYRIYGLEPQEFEVTYDTKLQSKHYLLSS